MIRGEGPVQQRGGKGRSDGGLGVLVMSGFKRVE